MGLIFHVSLLYITRLLVYSVTYEHTYNYVGNEIIPGHPQANLEKLVPGYYMEKHLLYDAFHSVQKAYILKKKYDHKM